MNHLIDKFRELIIESIRKSIIILPPKVRRKKASRIIRNHYPLVLMYHSVLPHYNNEDYTVSKKSVEQNIIDLIDDGYTFAFEDEFFNCPTQSVILTFDDGFANNYTEVFPLLKKYKAKATINLISDRISDPEGKYLREEQILEMESSGLVQFQSHTCSHRSLDKLTHEEVRYELKESKRKLQELLQRKVDVFVYPREDFTEDIANIASEYYDMCYGWSGEMHVDSRYTLPRIEIVENNSDYAYHTLFEYRMNNYHKVIWSIKKKKPTNTYRRVLFRLND